MHCKERWSVFNGTSMWINQSPATLHRCHHTKPPSPSQNFVTHYRYRWQNSTRTNCHYLRCAPYTYSTHQHLTSACSILVRTATIIGFIEVVIIDPMKAAFADYVFLRCYWGGCGHRKRSFEDSIMPARQVHLDPKRSP